MLRSVAALLLFLAGCATTSGRGGPSSEDSANLAKALARAQLERGETAYREHCSACHREENELGEKLTPGLLASYHSARSLHDYIDLAMPYNEPGSLSAEEAWAITAYLIEDRGVARLDAPLAADVAADVRLTTGTTE